MLPNLAFFRPLRTLGFAVAVVLLPSLASSQTVASCFEELAGRLHPGDTVWVMDGANREVRGEFVELSQASLALLVNGDRREWAAVDVKRIKRATKSQPNAFARETFAAAGSCDDIECLPATLVLVGVAALGDSIDSLVRRPKIVYQAPVRCSR